MTTAAVLLLTLEIYVEEAPGLIPAVLNPLYAATEKLAHLVNG